MPDSAPSPLGRGPRVGAAVPHRGHIGATRAPWSPRRPRA